MGFTEKLGNAFDKAKNKLEENLTDEKQAEYKEKFGTAMDKLDKKLDTAFDKAKTKIDESLTEEKKAEYKQKADNAFEKADKTIDKIGNKITDFFNN